MAKLDCVVLTPERKVFSGEVSGLVVQTSNGKMGILPGHASLICRLGLGPLKIKDGDSENFFFVEGGFLEVSDNKVTILAEFVQNKDELVKSEIEAKLLELQKKGLPQKVDDIIIYNNELARCKEKLKILANN